MNDPLRNQTYLDNYYECLNQGYVGPVLCQCTQILCFLLGTPALVWCLWISLSGSLSGGLKPTLVFPINLFMVELVMCVEGPMEVICYLFGNNIIVRQALYVPYYLTSICRALVQTCICVERYLAVAQPVTFLKYRLRRYRVGTSTLIWGFSLIYACFTIPLLGCQKITAYVLVGVYGLALVIISLCCLFILRVLNQPGPGEVEGGRGGEKQQGTKDPQKMRAFRIILTNLVIIVVSSISVVAGYAIVSSGSFDYHCNVFPILLLVNIFSVLVSPLLHLHREGRLPCRGEPKTR